MTDHNHVHGRLGRSPETDHGNGAPPTGRGAPATPNSSAAGLPASLLGADPSVREVARAAREAFLGADLLRSGPTLWPFGQRARRRRERNTKALDQARRRRRQFQQAFDAQQASRSRPPGQRGRIDRRTNRIVIAALAGFALAVIAVGSWLARPEPAPAGTAPVGAAATTSEHLVSPSTAAPAPSTGTAAMPAQPPIPPGGVTPITPRPHPTVNPATVAVVDPPAGDPTPSELATPQDAVRAWLARWCPFDYRQPFGTAERRARPAMTDAAWNLVDPSQDATTRASWDQTVAARESGRCAPPTALASPEAPRTPTTAIVIGSVTRVVNADGQQPYVEQLTEVRIVRRGADGLWRVDLPTEGG